MFQAKMRKSAKVTLKKDKPRTTSLLSTTEVF